MEDGRPSRGVGYMLDIKFYQELAETKKRLAAGETFDGNWLFEELEKHRSRDPVLFNIETTNACNMRCVMCPRTTMMTRRVETLDMETFKKAASQIRPFSASEWKEWEEFCERYYGV